MLKKEQKKEIVKKLAENLKNSKSVVFLDFRGIPVKHLTMLKKELRQEEISMLVTKKTLMNLALKKADIAGDVKKMEGQIALSISQKDEVIPAKIIDKFSKINENLKIVGGILAMKMMSSQEMKALAKLPSKDELRAKLVETLNAPISGFVNVLTGNLRGLMQVLKAISEKQ